MYQLYNINGNEPLIYHINGSIPENFENFIYSAAGYNQKLECPEDLTVIFCETNYMDIINHENTQKYQLLLYQLEANNIPCINGYYPYTNRFYMIDKSRYLLNALKQVKTKYVLALDARDVKIRSFEGIIEKFKTYNTRVLFGAEKGNFGIQYNIIEQSNNTLGSNMKYMNTGCMIGYTEDCLKFYQNIIKEMDNEGDKLYQRKEIAFFNDTQFIAILPMTDQGYVRQFLNNCNSNFINVDYKSLIFLNCAYIDIYVN